jgi:hypothetical protein
VKTTALGLAAIALAIAVSCTEPAGVPCTTHQDCAATEYCEPLLGACARWLDRDPSCQPGCAALDYCSKGACLHRFLSAEITRLQDRDLDAGRPVSREIDIAYWAHQDIAAKSTIGVPYFIRIDATAEDGGVFSALQGPLPPVERGTATTTLGFDASVRLQLSFFSGPSDTTTYLRTQPIGFLVDQTL